MTNEPIQYTLMEISIDRAISTISLTQIDPSEIEDFELCDIMRGGMMTNTQKMLATDENGEITDISDHLDHGTLFF